jgi:hypothetical protein
MGTTIFHILLNYVFGLPYQYHTMSQFDWMASVAHAHIMSTTLTFHVRCSPLLHLHSHCTAYYATVAHLHLLIHLLLTSLVEHLSNNEHSTRYAARPFSQYRQAWSRHQNAKLLLRYSTSQWCTSIEYV